MHVHANISETIHPYQAGRGMHRYSHNTMSPYMIFTQYDVSLHVYGKYLAIYICTYTHTYIHTRARRQTGRHSYIHTHTQVAPEALAEAEESTGDLVSESGAYTLMFEVPPFEWARAGPTHPLTLAVRPFTAAVM